MVQKSVLIYSLLKSHNINQGLTKKEILKLLQEKYDFSPGKTIRQQIDIALRRGIDFGIVMKKNDKYKFVTRSWKRKQIPKCKKCSSNRKGKTTRSVNTPNKRPPEVPNPTVPNLPNLNPIRRDIRQEPFAKLVKHHKTKKKH
ncbi:uncharacterized protein LOC127277121 [Leptopilina boulardi]|uniref:uncharacterized protein LOC127277121 n=1 Tax=Leptopilina boulardi TaxID=63433 RepID=UPI0021F632BC|nr:uncharacterized protein LOC127277121 [Leptopilina boulardi]